MSEKEKTEPQVLEIAGMKAKIKPGNVIEIPKSEYFRFREEHGETKEHREIEATVDQAYMEAVLPVLEEKVIETHEAWTAKGGSGDRSLQITVAGETTGFNPATREPVTKYGRTTVRQHRELAKPIVSGMVPEMQARIQKSYEKK